MNAPPHFCKADPQQLALAEQLQYGWPDPNLPVAIMDELPRVDYETMKAAILWGLGGWKGCCGLKPVFEASASKARLLVYTAKIDGPSNVLADCELPAPGACAVKMRLDLGEDWDADVNTPAGRMIKLGVVVRHEGGHGIGLSHAPAKTKNWMAPVYDPSVTAAGSFDTSESQNRYGRPVAIVPPVQPPTNPTDPSGGGFNVLSVLTKLMPVITWFIANKDQLAPLLAALKTIFDAFQAAQPQKPAALTAEPLLDKSVFRTVATSWAQTFAETAKATPWPWDDTAATLLTQAVGTDWLMDLLYLVATGQLHVSDGLLQEALKGNVGMVQALVAGQ